MDGGEPYNPRTVEEVFRDFKGRRAGLIKALTTDVEDFYQQCDPEKGKVCLYGFPSEQWEVKLPAEEGPPDVPEPALGINFASDGMQEKDWLSLVAVHSDAWLLAVAFYFGARFGFDKADRERLFSMTNDLPTISEVVTGTAKKQVKEKSVRDFLYWRDPEVLCSLSSDLALIELGPRVHLGFGPTGASTSAEMTTPPTAGGPQQPQSSDDVPPVSTHPRTQDNPSTQQHPKPK